LEALRLQMKALWPVQTLSLCESGLIMITTNCTLSSHSQRSTQMKKNLDNSTAARTNCGDTLLTVKAKIMGVAWTAVF